MPIILIKMCIYFLRARLHSPSLIFSKPKISALGEDDGSGNPFSFALDCKDVESSEGGE